MIERPARSPKMEKPSDSGKTANEGIQLESAGKRSSGLVSSFSLSEKSAAQTGRLTSTAKPIS